MENTKVREWEAINVKPQTKERVNRLYFLAKTKKKYKSIDVFINEILDSLEEK